MELINGIRNDEQNERSERNELEKFHETDYSRHLANFNVGRTYDGATSCGYRLWQRIICRI